MVHLHEVRDLMGDDIIDQFRRQMDQAPMQADARPATATAPSSPGAGQTYRGRRASQAITKIADPLAKPVQAALLQGTDQRPLGLIPGKLQALSSRILTHPAMAPDRPAQGDANGLTEHRHLGAIHQPPRIQRRPGGTLGKLIQKPVRMLAQKALHGAKRQGQRRPDPHAPRVHPQGHGAPRATLEEVIDHDPFEFDPAGSRCSHGHQAAPAAPRPGLGSHA